MKERAPGSSMIGARQCGTDSGAPCYSENLFAEYPESGTALRQVEPLRGWLVEGSNPHLAAFCTTSHIAFGQRKAI